MNEEEFEKIVDLIEDYDICIKEAEYEGNVEQKEGLVETKILLEKVLNLISKQSTDISIQLKELDKKNKVIDLMAEYLNENNREFWTDDIEETKQYFYKKVEEENE